MGCLCKGRRPRGGPNREVTAPPSEAAAALYGAPGATPLHATPPSALPNWAAWHSLAPGIVFAACSRQASAN